MVVQNHDGVVLTSSAVIHEHIASAFIAEALVCTEAIKLRLYLRLKKVVIEGDVMSIIKKCKST